MVEPPAREARPDNNENFAMDGDPCPLCGMLVRYSLGSEEVGCSHCGNRLLIGSSDPTGHYLGQIDPDLGEGWCGEFTIELHPVGTTVCSSCRRIYPNTFECCPGLVDLALATLGGIGESFGPTTYACLVAFIRQHPKAVAGTVEVLVTRHARGELAAEKYESMRAALEPLELSDLLTG